MQAHFGSEAGRNFYRQARGQASAIVETGRARKSISKETTFSKDVEDPRKLHDVLRDLAAQVARTARREQLAGTVVTLKVRYRGFDTFTRQYTLSHATHDERLMLETAWSLFNNGTLPNKPVRLIGVGISGWGDATGSQADLFSQSGHGETDRKILETIDRLTDKYGKPVLQVGIGRRKIR
jgi:DNA polymerase-4